MIIKQSELNKLKKTNPINSSYNDLKDISGEKAASRRIVKPFFNEANVILKHDQSETKLTASKEFIKNKSSLQPN